MRDRFLLRRAVYWRDKLLAQKWLVSHGILSRYNTGVHHNSDRRWLRNYHRSTVYTTANFMWLRVNTFVRISLDCKWHHVWSVSVCVHKFREILTCYYRNIQTYGSK